ncbi:hypothetical protein [Ramlibacter albus]|uniref:Zinc-dependent peptidase n=1 Tax=Ramlibacter albus TaxID=2079448 RepID=A0A923S8V6_9BURK|nr:hypothetical protein [Ramlibacter albus]MBC5768457.1 hypothetical protein [Ramlibacter albus]
MSLTSRLCAVLLGLACLCAQAQEKDPFAAYGCNPGDRDCRVRVIHEHRAHKAQTWAADRARPLIERVRAAPDVLLEYMLLENIVQGFPEKPRAPAADAAFMRDLQDAVRELPPQVVQALDAKLFGIFLVGDLGGTGFADIVFNADGTPAGGLVLLDAELLARHTANAWATWKENTPFKPAPAWQLKARIAEDGADDRKGAIQYILLHELGHVLSMGSDAHPPFWKPAREAHADRAWPFFDLTWTVDRRANDYRPYGGHDFAQRQRLVYYLGAKLEASEMKATYDALENTNFPTLYAATRPADDFAEAFAKYVHVRLMKRPWEITLSLDGVPVKTVKPCWGTPRCAAKEAYLERLLRPPE